LEREKQFQDYAEMSSDWFWELDKDLHFKWMSCQPALREKIGAGVSVGSAWVDMLGDIDDEPAALEHLNSLNAHDSFRDFRFRRRDDRGQTFHFSVNGNPLFDSRYEFLGYRGTGRDVTYLVEFMNELRAAKSEAERSSRAKSDFVANMSHEFRTPLNAILGFSQIIQDEVHGPVQPPEYREYGGYIHDAGNHLLGLVNNVLDLSRIEAGHMELRREGVDIGCIISDCCTLVDGLAHQGGLILRNLSQQPLSLVEGDAIRLKQIVLNLLSNAIKFTQQGGSVEIDARHDEEGSMVIRVTDTGCGMRPEEIQRAQEPFQRLEGAQTRRVEGTGLGLFLAKRLAEMHGGSIDISSELGHGTTVRVILPANRILEPDRFGRNRFVVPSKT
jgi:signal transduction histidine kinase